MTLANFLLAVFNIQTTDITIDIAALDKNNVGYCYHPKDQLILSKHIKGNSTYVKYLKIFVESNKDKTHGEFWEWAYFNIEIPVKQEDSPSRYDLTVPENLLKYANTPSKKRKLTEFISGIPNIDTIKAILYPFFYNLTDEEIKTFFKYLRSRKSIYVFKDFHHIIKNEPLLKKIAYLEPKEVGKGEIFLVYFFEGASMMGGSEPFDIHIKNDKMDIIFEVKFQKTGAIRLGKAKVYFFKFSQIIQQTFDVVDMILKYNVKDHISSQLYSMMLQMEDIKNIWLSGEFSDKNINKLLLFYFLAHSHLKYNKYENLILELENGSNELKLKNKDSKNIIHLLQTIKYVDDPEQLYKDLNDTIKYYFEKNAKISYFIIVREREVNFCTSNDLTFERISQGGIKPTEKKNRKFKITIELESWREWKNDKRHPYEHYYNEKLKINPKLK